MLGRLIPRDEQFFELFDQLATHLANSARMVEQLFQQPERQAEHVRAIKDVEHKADLLTHDIHLKIDKSFITPIDPEDIHTLSTRLDDVIDLLDGIARRVTMLHIGRVKEPAAQLARALVEATQHIQRGVIGIKRPKDVMLAAVEVKRLEEEGDAIYHEAVEALFSGSPDPLEVIKWKELYDKLEDTLDSCMGVVQALQSISLKNA
jgi:hypothetical protein